MIKKEYIAPEITLIIADCSNVILQSPGGVSKSNIVDRLTGKGVDGPIYKGLDKSNTNPINAKENNNAWSTWDD